MVISTKGTIQPNIVGFHVNIDAHKCKFLLGYGKVCIEFLGNKIVKISLRQSFYGFIDDGLQVHGIP